MTHSKKDESRVLSVTCLFLMKLNSGGAMPKPTHTQASSDTLLFSMALGRLAGAADAGLAGEAVSPWGTFMFAAGGRRKREK